MICRQLKIEECIWCKERLYYKCMLSYVDESFSNWENPKDCLMAICKYAPMYLPYLAVYIKHVPLYNNLEKLMILL